MLAVLAACLPVVLPAASASGQQKKTYTYAIGPVEGRVLGTDGQPAAGAAVLLIQGRRDGHPAVLAETKADAEGRFRIEERKFDYISGVTSGVTILCRDAEGHLGGTSRARQRSADSPPQTENIEVQLAAVADYRGRLIDSAGKPIAGARLTPLLWTSAEVNQYSSDRYYFSADVVQSGSATTGDDGGFLLRGMPTGGTLYATITAEGFGRQYAYFTTLRPVTMQLERTGTVRGSLVPEGGGETTSQRWPDLVELNLRLSEPPRVLTAVQTSSGETRIVAGGEGAKPVDWKLIWFEETAPDAQGRFRFGEVPGGTYTIRPQLGDELPYIANTTEPFDVKPGEEAAVSVPLERAIAVRGKVVDKKTGEGIPGVTLYFSRAREPGEAYWGRAAKTDDRGEFTLYSKQCKLLVSPRAPEGYVNPPNTGRSSAVEVTADMTWPTIELEPAKPLELIVEDTSGNPVADAEIRVYSLDRSDPFLNLNGLRTDAAGKAAITKVAEGGKLDVRARTGKAASEPRTVTVGESDGPIRLVLDEKTSFALRGTVVSDSGKPVPGAKVQVMANISFGSFGVGFRLETSHTDAAGKIEVGGLWPGERYDVQVEAPGYAKVGTEKVEGTVGGVHDFGTLRLASAGGTVEGKVVDADGKPVAYARVFNSGDGPDVLESRSDAEGKFRLEGFFVQDLPVYVFAEKEGLRFTGLKTTCGTRDAVLVMRPAAAGAQGKPAETDTANGTPKETPSEEETKAAKELLEALWPVAASESRKRWILRELVKVDPPLARRWAKEAGLPAPQEVTLVQTATRDFELAMSKVANKKPAVAIRDLKTLADHFQTSDPDKAMRCVEEGVVLARSLDQPDRAFWLAEMGVLAGRLGSQEDGRQLVLEAAGMAEAWKSPSSYRLEAVAKAVGRFDLPRAVAMMKKLDDARGYEMAGFASSLDDVEAAESLLKDVDSYAAQQAWAKIAFRVGRDRPAEAVQLLEKTPVESGYSYREERKAVAFAWLATAVAPRDPELACSLIDRALDTLRHPSEPMPSLGSYGGRPAEAALVAVLALQVGYSDMESLIWQVLSMRPTASHGTSPVEVQESCTIMVQFLALVDRSTARDMLRAIEPNREVIGSGYRGVSRDAWLRAVALADPPKAVELALAELASAKDAKAKDRALSNAMGAVSFWTTPPGGRLKQLTRYSPGMRCPEEEF